MHSCKLHINGNNFLKQKQSIVICQGEIFQISELRKPEKEVFF